VNCSHDTGTFHRVASYMRKRMNTGEWMWWTLTILNIILIFVFRFQYNLFFWQTECVRNGLHDFLITLYKFLYLKGFHFPVTAYKTNESWLFNYRGSYVTFITQNIHAQQEPCKWFWCLVLHGLMGSPGVNCSELFWHQGLWNHDLHDLHLGIFQHTLSLSIRWGWVVRNNN
jgi:hypothetical protein